ncbi:Cytochrome protein, partial [Ophiophagus hannah]
MPSGIILSNGHTWKQQRHIGITSLWKLGLGKKSIEHQIEDGAQTLVEVFRQTKGQPFDPSLLVLNAICNIMCALSFGHQFVHEDENFQKLTLALKIIMYGLFPQIMKYLPGLHKEALASRELFLSFAKQEIEKQKKSHSLHEPQDFIDHYLLQMEKGRALTGAIWIELEHWGECGEEVPCRRLESRPTVLEDGGEPAEYWLATFGDGGGGGEMVGVACGSGDSVGGAAVRQLDGRWWRSAEKAGSWRDQQKDGSCGAWQGWR